MNENVKVLNEELGATLEKLDAMAATAAAEVRGFTDEETAEYDKLEKRAQSLQNTIAKLSEKRDAEVMQATTTDDVQEVRSVATVTDSKIEKRAIETRMAGFAEALGTHIKNGGRGTTEIRAGETVVGSLGGAVSTIHSEDVIRSAVSLSNVASLVSSVFYNGTYKQIVTDENELDADWIEEAALITDSEMKFTTVDITPYKLASLAKISLEALNQAALDVGNEATAQMLRAFAYKLEQGIIKGTGKKQPAGLITSGTAYNLEAENAITADELVKMMHKLKGEYQPGAVWIMNSETLAAIRLLKDGAGQYIFKQNDDFGYDYAGSILGKPVLISDVMDGLGYDSTSEETTKPGNKAIIYGDMSRAYKVNFAPGMNIQMLNERFIDYGVVGIEGIMWAGGAPIDSQAYVVAKCADHESEQ